MHSEAEVARILPIARRLGVPVTFRAAGTSLSGQAITDSVLLKLSHTGKNFRRYKIHVRLAALPASCGDTNSMRSALWSVERPVALM